MHLNHSWRYLRVFVDPRGTAVRPSDKVCKSALVLIGRDDLFARASGDPLFVASGGCAEVQAINVGKQRRAAIVDLLAKEEIAAGDDVAREEPADSRDVAPTIRVNDAGAVASKACLERSPRSRAKDLNEARLPDQARTPSRTTRRSRFRRRDRGCGHKRGG